MKQGHSNAYTEKTRPWHEIDPKTETGIACIPIRGGATILTCRDLPSLALRKYEWEEIGRRMGWLQEVAKV